MLLAMSSLAVAEFALNKDFLGFFNAESGQLPQQSGQEINMQDSNEEVVNIFRELIEENANTENYIEEISVNTIETNQATKEITAGY